MTACDKDCGLVTHMTGGKHRTDCAAYPTLYTWIISDAVAIAMSFDDLGMRKGYVGEAHVKRLKRKGYKITGTLDELRTLAHHMTRESGWDLAPSTIYACNQAAKKLRTFIDEAAAGKDLP